jgi:hypothetical protein
VFFGNIVNEMKRFGMRMRIFIYMACARVVNSGRMSYPRTSLGVGVVVARRGV